MESRKVGIKTMNGNTMGLEALPENFPVMQRCFGKLQSEGFTAITNASINDASIKISGLPDELDDYNKASIRLKMEVLPQVYNLYLC